MGPIIQSATDLFLTLGFKSVTMDDIARKMGISKKTIYIHFDNKSTLIKSCVFHLFEEITSEVERIRKSSVNPIEELYEVKLFVIKRLKNEQVFPQYQLQKYYPKIHHELQKKQFSFMINSVKKSLQQGVEMKLFRSDMNVDFIARMYFNGMSGIKNIEIFPPEIFQPKVTMEQYLEYHLRAIVTPFGLNYLNKFLTSNNE